MVMHDMRFRSRGRIETLKASPFHLGKSEQRDASYQHFAIFPLSKDNKLLKIYCLRRLVAPIQVPH